MPDIYVHENCKDFIDNKDLFMDKALEQINLDNQWMVMRYIENVIIK